MTQFVPFKINDEKTEFPPLGRVDTAYYTASLLGEAYYLASPKSPWLAGRLHSWNIQAKHDSIAPYFIVTLEHDRGQGQYWPRYTKIGPSVGTTNVFLTADHHYTPQYQQDNLVAWNGIIFA